MVENQIRTYDVTDQALLAVFAAVPREVFVAGGERATAYLDRLQTARDGKTRMLPPLVLARMIQSLEPVPGEKVLAVAGAGYSAAVMAAYGLTVTTLDHDAGSVRAALAEAGAEGVTVVAGAANAARVAGGPFDLILVEGAAEVEPLVLLEQLRDGGRLGIVMGLGRSGRVMIFRRIGGFVSQARAFDAAAPALPEFANGQVFAF